MKKYKILIVDDERPLAEMIRLNFDETKFDTRTANTGSETLEEAENNRPDLIILDVMLGDMDGFEILAKLRANPKTSAIPIIMCTARDGTEDIEKSFRGGAQAYTLKPVNFHKLMQKVTAILDMEELLRYES